MRYHLYSINTGEVISLDATTSFSESHKANVTEHPVEMGTPISDHVFLSNPTLNLKGIVTDYDVVNSEYIDLSSFSVSSIVQDVISLFKDPTDVDNIATQDDTKLDFRSIAVANALKKAFYDRHVFSLFVLDDTEDAPPIDHYNTVVIDGLTFTRSADNGGEMIEVDIALKQIRLAKIRRSEVTKAEKDALDKAVSQTAKSNATKDSTSGSSKSTKDGKGTKTSGDGAFSDPSDISKQFDVGAKEGEGAGSLVGKVRSKTAAMAKQKMVDAEDARKLAERNRAGISEGKTYGTTYGGR